MVGIDINKPKSHEKVETISHNYMRPPDAHKTKSKIDNSFFL